MLSLTIDRDSVHLLRWREGRMVAWFAALSVILSSLAAISVFPVRASETDNTSADTSTEAEGTYGWFLKNEAALPGKVLISLAKDTGTAVKDKNGMLWTVTVDQPGRYWIKTTYLPGTEDTAEIDGQLKVNGTIPYNEFSNFVLPREYKDAGEPMLDEGGNQIRPEQKLTGRSVETLLYDYDGDYSEPLSINLNAGKNIVELDITAGSADLEGLTLVPSVLPSYRDVEKSYADSHLSDYNGKSIQLEAEKTYAKSDSTLYPISDRSSPLISPVSTNTILLNVIGGSHWQTVGQYIEWEIDVPQDALYTLSFKLRQNIMNGQKCSRILTVNGEIPFQEAAQISVPYSNKWQILTLGGTDQPYRFHLKKGSNIIRLQATLGGADKPIRTLENSVKTLNDIYRKLLIIIGPTPDTARDYKLTKLVPELFVTMKQQVGVLTACADQLDEFNGSSNAGTGLIRTMVRQLQQFIKDSSTVAQGFSYFKTNIGALGAWLSDARQQPLEVDFLTIGSGSDLQPVNAGLVSQMSFDVRVFFSSFFTDYRMIGNMPANGKTENSQILRVWYAGGRDQAQVIRSMIGDSFSSQYGIRVNFELVNSGALLPAVVAGIGPDISLGSTDVINFAMRNASYNLKQFPDFTEIAARFNKALFIPLSYCNGVYGLPENLSFFVMFYRSDIFKELDIKVPETWEDVIAISSVLAKNNMEFGLPAGSTSYLMMLRQRGLDIYNKNGSVCILDSADAIDTFQFYTDFYVNYGFPLTYDLLNRFRSGEMTAAIADFGLYNSLQVAAPEIKGLWNFALVPGPVNKDGQVNHTSLSSSTSAMILSDTKNPQASWTFLKWWTSTDMQTRYGREIESALGPSARYSSANLKAFAQSSWSRDSMAILKRQMESLDAVEQVPGGYFLTRHLDNAFRNVVYDEKKPMDMIFDYVYKINQELTEKRHEFGLPTTE